MTYGPKDLFPTLIYCEFFPLGQFMGPPLQPWKQAQSMSYPLPPVLFFY